MKTLNFFIFSSTFLLLFSACKDDPPPPEPQPVTSGVFIGNEGVFPNGTASLSIYNTSGKTVEQNIFQKANPGSTMGNVLNSLYMDDAGLWCVMNGSAQVLLVDPETYKLKKRIKNFIEPRHIVRVRENNYYISEWLEQGVVRYNLNSGIGKTIKTGNGPENMLVFKDLLFVANGGNFASSDSTITVIHALADTIVATLNVGHNPNSMQIVGDTALWVLTSGIKVFGNQTASTSGTLERFNVGIDSLAFYIDTLKQEDSLVFADNQLQFAKMQKDPDENYLYFLDQFFEGNLLRFDLSTGFLPASPFIAGKFYGLGIDPVNEEIYLAISKSSEPGTVNRYELGGSQIDQFEVGVFPSSFEFK